MSIGGGCIDDRAGVSIAGRACQQQGTGILTTGRACRQEVGIDSRAGMSRTGQAY